MPWLLGIAHKVIATTLRTEQRAARLTERLDRELREGSGQDEDRLELVNAFQSLPDRDREALMLVAWDGLTAAEAAEVLGCSKASFSVRLHRARRRLGEQMEHHHRHSPLPSIATSEDLI